MTKALVFYPCENCEEHYPEGSLHLDRSEVRVLPDGEWVCEGCYDDLLIHATWPRWRDLPKPPEHRAEPVSETV